MGDQPEVWVDHDYMPLPRQYEQCRQCVEDRTLRHHCDLQTEIMKLRGMIWWLAAEIAADDGDPDSTPETLVALAEKYWQQGLRLETRPLKPSELRLNASDWAEDTDHG